MVGKIAASVVLCLFAAQSVRAFDCGCTRYNGDIDNNLETQDGVILEYNFDTPLRDSGVLCKWRSGSSDPVYIASCDATLGLWSGLCDESVPTRLVVTYKSSDSVFSQVYCNTGSYSFQNVLSIVLYSAPGSGATVSCNIKPS